MWKAICRNRVPYLNKVNDGDIKILLFIVLACFSDYVQATHTVDAAVFVRQPALKLF